MFILQFVGWFVASCILMSFIEHQVHSRLMHKKNFFSERHAYLNRTFEAHANVHHKHYTKIFHDEPVPRNTDQEIRMNPFKGMLRSIPIALLLSIVSWQWALTFVAVVGLHHKIWNMIHLEMHKPEHRFFSTWPAYTFLARHHCLHHLHQNKNFNVVFPFADYVMGTNVKPSDSDLKSLEKFGLLGSTQKTLTRVG